MVGLKHSKSNGGKLNPSHMQYSNTCQMSSQGFDHLRRHHHHDHHHHDHHHHLRPHHHHCHGVLSYCAFHNHYFHCHCHRHRHRQGSNIVTPLPPPQNPEYFDSFPVGNNSNMVASEHKAFDGDAAQISQEQEHLELDEEEDEEPIFVLTDEWRDFFAKSEARRQQEKLLRKKGKK